MYFNGGPYGFDRITLEKLVFCIEVSLNVQQQHTKKELDDTQLCNVCKIHYDAIQQMEN